MLKTRQEELADMAPEDQARARSEDRYIRLGRRIKAIRESEGLTQKDVADRLVMNENTFGRYEAGNRRIPLPDLERLATILGVSIVDLLDDQATSDDRTRAIQPIDLSRVPVEHRERVRRAILAMVRQLEEEDTEEEPSGP
jgi:transcriptional regulator with XRE-family HTH domain